MNTNDKSLISVILPTYNRSNVVTRAIDSILCQSYSNIEIIVVDDGSTDNTETALEKYSGKITYVKQDNAGASSARNHGIEVSNGEYIAFLDSDDQWGCEKLSLQYEFIKNNNVALVSTLAYTYDENNSLKKSTTKSIAKKSIKTFEDVFQHPYLGTPTVLVKKDVLVEAGGFDESLRTAEDIDLFLRIASKHNIGYIDKPLVNIYLSNDGLSTGLDSYDDNLTVFRNIVAQNSDYFSTRKNIVNNVMSDLYNDYARELLWNDRPKEARKLLRKSLNYSFSLETLFLLIKSFLKR